MQFDAEVQPRLVCSLQYEVCFYCLFLSKSALIHIYGMEGFISFTNIITMSGMRLHVKLRKMLNKRSGCF